jgi:hypothetical protein
MAKLSVVGVAFRMFLFLAILLMPGLLPNGARLLINFLPVGFTHEDIDALFAHISRLGNFGALTILELRSSIQSFPRNSPRVQVVNSVVDAWAWISGMKIDTELSGLLKFRSFEITLSSAGAALLRAKPDMCDGDECYSAPIVLVPGLPSPLPPLDVCAAAPSGLGRSAAHGHDFFLQAVSSCDALVEGLSAERRTPRTSDVLNMCGSLEARIPCIHLAERRQVRAG